MAEIKQVKVDGAVYDVCDQTARNSVAEKQDKLVLDASITASASGVPTSAAVRAYLSSQLGAIENDSY